MRLQQNRKRRYQRSIDDHGHGRDANCASRECVRPRSCRFQSVHECPDTFGAVDNRAASLRRAKPPKTAFEQPGPQTTLRPGDVAPDRTLVDTELPCGTRQRLATRHGEHEAQIIPVKILHFCNLIRQIWPYFAQLCRSILRHVKHESAPGNQAMLYAVLLEDNDDHAEMRSLHMPEHLAFLEHHADKIRAAGPLKDPATDTPAGGLWLVDADTSGDVRALVEADPFWPTGLRKSCRILEWKQVFGNGN